MVNRNTKILNLFKLILLIVCLSILCIYSWIRIKILVSNAEETGDVRSATASVVAGGVQGPFFDRMLSSYVGSTFGGGELHYSDLETKPYILCREHGTILRPEGQGYWLNYQGTKVNGTIVTAGGHAPLTVDKEAFATITEADGKPPSIYMVGENRYWSESYETANPMEAYVLSHVGEKAGHPSEVQIAWWNTEFTGHHNIKVGCGGISNGITVGALDFQNFVAKATNGNIVAGDNGFNLPTPTWNHPDAKVSVCYKDDQFIIGPFGVNYTRYITSKDYGSMDSIKLYTDKQPGGVEIGNGWWVRDSSGNDIRNSKDVPEGGADFYVVIPYVNGQSSVVDKKITNMTAEVKYMNGKGHYQKLDGDYTFRMYKVGSTRSDSLFINPEHFKDVSNPEMKIKINIGQKYPELTGLPRIVEFECKFEKDGTLYILHEGKKYKQVFGPVGTGVYQVYQKVTYDGKSTLLSKAQKDDDEVSFEDWLASVFGVMQWSSPEKDEDTKKYHWERGSFKVYSPGEVPGAEISPITKDNVHFPDKDEYQNYNEGDTCTIDEYVTEWEERTEYYLGLYGETIADVAATDITYANYGGSGVYNGEIDLQYGSCAENDVIDSSSEEYWIFGTTADAVEIIENDSEECGSVPEELRTPLIVIGQIKSYEKKNPEDWQLLNCAIDGSIWYQRYKLDMRTVLNDTKLSIEKEMKDPNGNDIDVDIPFNLHVSGNTIIPYEDKLLSVNPKSPTSTDSQVFYYQSDDGLDFRLTEMIDTNDERYKDYRITSVTATNVKGEDITGDIHLNGNEISGKMRQNLLKLHIVNEATPKTESGKLRIDKKVVIPNLPPNDSNSKSNNDNSYFIKNKKFAFKVTLVPGNKSSFKYAGTTYVDASILKQYKRLHPSENVVAGNCEFIKVVKARGENDEITNEYIAETEKIEWYKNTEKPSYTVEEITAEELRSIAVQNEIKNTYGQADLNEIIESSKDSYGNVVENGSGYVSSDCEYVSISSKNTQDSEKGRLKIVKTLDLNPYRDLGMNDNQIKTYVDQQIANNEFDFKFKVRVGNEDEKLITLASSGAYTEGSGNDLVYKWTWESEEYEWLKGNEIPYTITEVTNPNDVCEPTEGDLRTGTLKRVDDVIIQENYSRTEMVEGTINNGSNEEVVEVTNYFKNKPKTDAFSIIINKKMDEKTWEKLKGKDIHFVVNLDGWFKYGDESDKHGSRRVRITNNDYQNGKKDVLRELFDVEDSTELKELPSKENEQYITLHVPETYTEDIEVWDSQYIYYLPKAHDLKLMIYEDRSNLGDEIVSTLVDGIEPGVWVDMDDINFRYKSKSLEVNYNNTYNDDKNKVAFLRIHKIVEGASTLSDEEAEKLKFTFKVKATKQKKSDIAGTSGPTETIFDKYVTLDKKNFDSKLNTWEWVDSTPITWNPDEYETPIYEICECEDSSSDSIKFSNCWSAGSYLIDDDYKLDDITSFERKVSIAKKTIAGKVVEKGKSEALVTESAGDGTEETKTTGTDEYSETNDVYFKNTTDQQESNEGYIRLHKEITSSNLENKQYAFLIKFIGGKFKLAGNETVYTPSASNPLYLTADNTLVQRDNLFVDGHLDPEKAIIVNVAKGETISETWTSSVFKWDVEDGVDNSPEFEVGDEYYRDISTNSLDNNFEKYDKGGIVSVSNGTEAEIGNVGTPLTGRLIGEVTFNFKNGYYRLIDKFLVIRKKIALSDITTNLGTNISNSELESYLKGLKFGFNINIVEDRSIDTYARFVENDGTYCYYQTDRINYSYEKGKTYKYQVVETSMPEGFAFEKWEGPNGEAVTEKVYNGELSERSSQKLTVVAKNKLGENTSKTRLQIVKENIGSGLIVNDSGGGSGASGATAGHYMLPLQEDGLIGQGIGPGGQSSSLKFQVKIKVPNGAKNVRYILDGEVTELSAGQTYYLGNMGDLQGKKEVLNTSSSNMIRMIIEGTSAVWNSEGIIEWDESGEVPTYEINEDPISIASRTYNPRYNGSNNGTLSEKINNLLTVYLDNKDIPTSRQVHLQIKKEIEGGSNTDKTFKFKVEVEGYETRYVTIKKDASGKFLSKELSYDLPEGKDSLAYKVTEVDIPLGSHFVKMYEDGSGNNSVEDPSKGLAGKLTTTKNIVVVCKNDEATKPSGSALYIKKTGVKKGEYSFKVRITAKNGVSITGGKIGCKYIEPGDTFEQDITMNVVSDNSEMCVGNFEWAGGQDGAPSYSIEENEIKLEDNTTKEEYYVTANSGYASKVRITNGAGVLTNDETVVVTQENKVNKTGGYIKFTKKFDNTPNYQGKKYKFAVYVYDPHDTRKTSEATPIYKYENIEISSGETWTSDYIEWEKDYHIGQKEINGKNETVYIDDLKTNAPKYYIKEIGADPAGNTAKYSESISGLKSMEPVEGEITKDTESGKKKFTINKLDTITGDVVTNGVTDEKINWGTLKIRKEVASYKAGLPPNSAFTIRLTIKSKGTFRIDGLTGWTSEYTKEIVLKHHKASDNGDVDPWTRRIEWPVDSEPPTVSVEEIDLDKVYNDGGEWQLVGISNNNKGLIKDKTLEIVVNNEFNGIPQLFYKIGGDVWLDRLNEVNKSTAEAEGLMDAIYTGTKNGKKRFEWSEEDRVANVEVYIYKAGTKELAKLYSETGGQIKQPLMTDENGHWGASILLPDIGSLDKIYVAYVYDGQTYEPTNPLSKIDEGEQESTGGAFSNTSANEYRRAGSGSRWLWQYGSMAKDVMNGSGDDIFGNYNRTTSENKMNKIQGNTPMDRYGNTVGTAVGSDGTERNLYYTSTVADPLRNPIDNTTGFVERAVSKLSTTNNDGTVRDEFKVVATTEEVGLTFPFDNHLTLTNADERTYVAGYPYSQHINLGLKERKNANLVAVKDLDSATIVVDGRVETYKFNTLDALVNRMINIEIENGKLKDLYDSNDANTLMYTLGLFKTDYFYRAELYQTGKDYDKLYNFYKNIMDINSTEMEVFLTYKYSVYNESTYYAKVYTLDDYYDESLELVTSNVDRVIRNKNGKDQPYAKTTVVDIRDKDGRKNIINNGTQITPNVKDGKDPTKMFSSDGHVYNKVTFKLKDSNTYSADNTNIWKPGEIKKYYATYRVSKGNVENITDSIIMGTKSNILEIGSYSTGELKSDKFSSRGKIDYNSAPSNVNIQQYNTEARYEDDTYRAKVKLGFEDNSKTVSGKAWEDKKKSDGSALGDGKYDAGNEALIGGLTTELVEKLKINEQEYDFLWPTDRKIDSLGGKTFEELTGFDSTLQTSRNADDGGIGSYKFENVPTGDYIVRFEYGDKKESQLDETIALKDNGEQWSTGSKAGVYTANYYGKKYGQTPAVYNGQDYKTTIYHSGAAQDNNNNDARDNEARRFEVMSNSQTITNSNGSDMYEANKASGNHRILNEKYSMFADSDKIKIPTNIKESDNDISGTYISWTKKSGDINYKKMSVSDLDIGIIERPENKLVLDKEISSIRLTTNDGKLLFNAVYDIKFDVAKNINIKGKNEHVIISRIKGNDYLVVKKTLNKNKSTGIEMMQALDKIENKLEYEGALNAGVQNFRFVNIDNDILQGMNVELNYKVYALNVGEKDYTSTAINRLSGERNAADILHQMSEIIAEYGHYNYGEYDKYIDFNRNNPDKRIEFVDNQSDKIEEKQNQFNIGLGKYYYSGKITKENLVSTRIREVLDYIDTDAVFETESNKANEHYWKNISVAELDGNGNLGNRLISMLKSNVDTILDKDQRQYVTSTQNNLAVNVDVIDDASISNKEFEKELYPYVDSDQNFSSLIDVTAIKRTSSEDDADSMAYDNLVEILKYENTVGRRDMTTVPGDVSPKLGEFVTSLDERDASSTELITFTPPTGIVFEDVMTNQLLIVIASAFSIVVVGVVIIKKKVIKK